MIGEEGLFRLGSTRILGPVLAAAMLAGCITASETPGPALAPAPMPEYRVRDYYKFDNGVTERVVRVEGDTVNWAVGTVFTFATYRQVELPRPEWQAPTARAVQVVADVPRGLWPLQVGNSVRFYSENTLTKAAGGQDIDYTEHRLCEVEGTESVTVPAGTFDTYRIACDRFIGGRRSWVGTRIWHYAPDLGHYVMRTDRVSGTTKKMLRLVSYGVSLAPLNEDDQRDYHAAVQKALGTLPSGETISWQSSDGSRAADITPTATFRSDSGAYCRTYSQVLTIDDRPKTIRGSSCRGEEGLWRAATAG